MHLTVSSTTRHSRQLSPTNLKWGTAKMPVALFMHVIPIRQPTRLQSRSDSERIGDRVTCSLKDAVHGGLLTCRDVTVPAPFSIRLFLCCLSAVLSARSCLCVLPNILVAVLMWHCILHICSSGHSGHRYRH